VNKKNEARQLPVDIALTYLKNAFHWVHLRFRSTFTPTPDNWLSYLRRFIPGRLCLFRGFAGKKSELSELQGTKTGPGVSQENSGCKRCKL